LGKIVKGNVVSLQATVTIFNVCIKPALTYRAQTWSLTETQLEIIRSNQRTVKRSILEMKRKDNIRNTTTRKTSGLANVGYMELKD